jgi:hypothetical protein
MEGFMRSWKWLVWTGLWLGLAGCIRVGGPAAATFGVSTQKAEDVVTVEIGEAGQTAVFDITSPSGIGGAEVELLSGAWPGEIRLRYHLPGLEEMRFAYDEVQVTASVSSTGTGEVRQAVSLAGQPAQPITAVSPYWMPYQRQSNAFEFQLPADFYQAAPAAFSLNWIDFYR